MFGYALAMVPLLLAVIIGGGFLAHRSMGTAPGIIGLSLIGILLTGVTVPSSYALTQTIVQNGTVGGYEEYWNGWETNAVRKDTTCFRDGFCRHTYNCDPYTEVEYYTDSEGKSKTRIVTKYHSCPYSKQETDFIVNTTVEDVVIASNVMTGEQFRFGHPIPGGRQDPPAAWREAKARVDANKPAPATFVKKYENYLLGSDDATFRRYEGNIDAMRAQNLLPEPSKGLLSYYAANKTYTAGDLNPAIAGRYLDDVARLNGAFGGELQGDLHVVFAPADMGWSSTDYIESLMAYWQSPSHGKQTISKNSLVVVIGVEDDTVKWADARTGMPMGNDALRIDIRETLAGLPLDDNLLGSPSYDLRTGTTKHSEGVLESLLWGENAYERVSMSGDDADDVGAGFGYLKDSIQPKGHHLFIAGVLTLLLTSGLAAGIVALMTNFSGSSTRSASAYGLR